MLSQIRMHCHPLWTISALLLLSACTVESPIISEQEGNTPELSAGTPAAPRVSPRSSFWLPAPVNIGDWVGQIDASDMQGDSVEYTLTGDNLPFEIDNNGQITVSADIDHNRVQDYSFSVVVRDSANESVSTVDVGLLSQLGVRLERWDGITGNQLASLLDSAEYERVPDHTQIIPTLDVQGGVNDNYGLQLTAYLRPEVSGDYYFSVAGDDASAFEISSSIDVEQAVRVVERFNHTSYQNWSKANESKAIRLIAGRAYYVRVLMKEALGADHVSVGWRTADEDVHTLIPSSQLFVGTVTPESVKPVFELPSNEYLIGQARVTGSLVVSVAADDAQNDSLRYSIIGAVPFAIDQNGDITISDVLRPDTRYEFTVSTTDGRHTASTRLVITTTVGNEVEHAIATGDAFIVSRAALLEDEILSTIDKGRTLHDDALIEVFNLDADGQPRSDGQSLTELTWNPTWDSSLIEGSFGDNRPLLTTNSIFSDGYDIKNRTLGLIGESDARYMVLGGNPMRSYRRNSSSLNEQMHQFLENSLAWLTDRTDLKNESFNVVIANMGDSFYFPDEQAVRQWLDERFPGTANYNDRKSCDDSALGVCVVPTTDLLIISQHSDAVGNEQAVEDAVAAAMEQGIAVLYVHHDGHLTALGSRLLALMNTYFIGDNYWHRLGLNALDQSALSDNLPEPISSLQAMMRNFQQQSFAVNWSDCVEENCSANPSLKTQFLDGATYVRSIMRRYDANKQNIFDQPSQKRLDKLLALLGDYYRSDVIFPMDRLNTPDIEFFKAFYADHAQYQYRETAGTWSDLGNFSRADFNHITPTSRIVNHVSKRHFRSTGAYALPGRRVTVTRNDTSEVDVTVFVNTVRDGATHVYADNGYKRPRFIRGQSLPIEPGETISFVSSIGGPIQLGYSANDFQVEVVFSNIGEHAHWRRAQDNDSFTAKLAAEEFDWAEVATPSFEVHSKSDKMQTSVNNTVLLDKAGDTQALVDAIMRYVHNFPHALAGFQGPGIDVIPEIHDFAISKGLPIADIDIVKHMNADQAYCGYGCSGNPYDAYWSFNPVGHGDIHEMGHGLEKARFRLSGWPVHASTNFYSYYTKSQYYLDTGAEADCQSLPFQSIFNTLYTSQFTVNPMFYLRTNLWDSSISWSEGAVQIIQMMMSAQHVGALKNGWHLLAHLHIIERAYQTALRDDAAWADMKDALGMGLYERAAAKSMSTEDWLLIAVSHATGFDYRDYLNVWGHTYTSEADAQVAEMLLAPMPPHFYISSGRGYCAGEGFDGNSLALDGTLQVWPMNDQPMDYFPVVEDHHNHHHVAQ